jgi:hypothetical protein
MNMPKRTLCAKPNRKERGKETMSNKQYVTITHYKEREFYYLNHAIQTNDGFIPKEIEQFHESEKEQFIERIRALQALYPTHHVISLSLAANQVVQEKEDLTKASAKIFDNNYVIQEKIDIGNIPTTLYFSPFAVLYQEYKDKLDDKLTLMIGLFDRKLYIMFATKDKIHQSWTLGTRGLTEKQIADRVYKSMKAYYQIAFKFADHIEMLITDDSPKLLKVLREELSMSILPTQKTIHYLLHNMGSDQRKFSSSYIRPKTSRFQELEEAKNSHTENLEDIRLNATSNSTQTEQQPAESFLDKLKSLTLFSFLPLILVALSGLYFTVQNQFIQEKIDAIKSQSVAEKNNLLLVQNTQKVFDAMGKSAELSHANISSDHIQLKGIVWGIEPLQNKLNELFHDGDFIIKPLEDFTTEFSFKAKV